MRKMGIHAMYRQPRTTIPAPGKKIYPYLLNDLVIDWPNKVCSADIKYLPIACGFLCMVAIMHWNSRKGLSWWLSNTLTADFRV
jgi:putative transposase